MSRATHWLPAAALVLATPCVAQDLVAEFDGGIYGRNRNFGSRCDSIGDLDADGVADLLIGASGGRGHVYVMSAKTGAILATFDGEAAADWFAESLASIGDVDGDGVDDFLVGAPRHDGPAGNDIGKAYVYSGATLSLIRVHDGESSGRDFGFAAAAIGDVDLDGVGDYAIGAPSYGTAAAGQIGRAYVFSGSTGAVLFTVDGTFHPQRLGCEVAPAGDLDGDGIVDLAVGSIDSVVGLVGRGRVDVFSGANRSTLLSIVGAPPFDAMLGARIRGGVDLDQDNIPDLLVTDRVCSRSASYAGAAYVYSGKDGSILFAWDGEAANDGFGTGADFVGDMNGDGITEIAVGSAVWKLTSPTHLYSGSTGRLLHRFTTPNTNDSFGFAVCGVPDFTGDGLCELLVTAPQDDRTATDAGRAYLYSGNDLFLQARPPELATGDVVSIVTSCREPNVLCALLLVAVNGTPTSVLVDLGTADPFGERTYVDTIPPGLAGTTASLLAFAQDSSAGVVVSSIAELTFR